MIEVDVWRAANLIIENHGEYAITLAAMRSDEMFEKGDTAGAAAWRKIAKAIEVLCAQCQTGASIE
jgi:hypothetical protein